MSVEATHVAERMPDMLKAAGAGAILGFLGAVGIYLGPEEPIMNPAPLESP